MILVISHSADEHGSAVLAELKRLGAPASLLDLSDFPQRLSLEVRYRSSSGHSYILHRSDGTAIDLDECHAIWWRRPQAFTLHPEIQGHINHSFAYVEAVEAFAGLWQAMDAFWVNPPGNDTNAHRKLHQLRVAQDVGLTIPDTLITSDPALALAFARRHGITRTVYKAFSGTREAWRETRLLKEGEIELIDAVRFAPVIFQEYIEAVVDLRVTVVGPDVFPVALYSQESVYPVDFRMDMANTRIEPHALPPDVVDGLHALMQRFGIVYGAIDMRLTPQGEYVFLEVNPAGQWLFAEVGSELPITAALARLLAERDAGSRTAAEGAEKVSG